MSKHPMSYPTFESRTSNSNSRINALINVKLPHPPLPGNPLDIWTFKDWFIQIPTYQDQNNNQTPHQSAAFDRQFVFVQGSSDLNILVDLSAPIFLKIKHTYSAGKTWQVQFEFPTPPRQSSNSQPQAWNAVNYPRLPGRGDVEVSNCSEKNRSILLTVARYGLQSINPTLSFASLANNFKQSWEKKWNERVHLYSQIFIRLCLVLAQLSIRACRPQKSLARQVQPLS